MPGLASKNSQAPSGRSTATATTGRPDLTASEAGRSPMKPRSMRCAANPASTRGPLSNSTKLTLYLAPARACEAWNSVCSSCCWSPTFSTGPGESCPVPGPAVFVPAALLAHADAMAVTLASDRAHRALEMADMGVVDSLSSRRGTGQIPVAAPGVQVRRLNPRLTRIARNVNISDQDYRDYRKPTFPDLHFAALPSDSSPPGGAPLLRANQQLPLER